MHSLYKYWFCCENRKKELSTSYLEECKNKIKKKKMYAEFAFIDLELALDSDSDSE